MYLGQSLAVCVLIGSMCAFETCPDGRQCDGTCCLYAPWKRSYSCCAPNRACVGKYGFNLCLPRPIGTILDILTRAETSDGPDEEKSYSQDLATYGKEQERGPEYDVYLV